MRRKKKIEVRYIVFFLLIGITIILGSLFFTLNENRSLTFFEKGIKDIGLSIQKIIYFPINWFNVQVKESKENKLMYKDYQEMKDKIEEYETLNVKYNEVKKELNEITELMNLNTNLSIGTYVNATMINKNMDYWYQSITLDKGSKNGIKKGNAVVNSKGLIGYIETTSNYYSTVKLLTADNLNHKISIKIEVGESYVYGLLTNYDKSKNLFKIEGISENTGIPKSSIVTTTGLGNNFPAGLIIGYVESVKLDNFELAKTVYIKPAVNFNDLNHVMIVKKDGEV